MENPKYYDYTNNHINISTPFLEDINLDHEYFELDKTPCETSISENTITYKFRINEPQYAGDEEYWLDMIPIWKKEPWWCRAIYYYTMTEDEESQWITQEISGYFEEN